MRKTFASGLTPFAMVCNGHAEASKLTLRRIFTDKDFEEEKLGAIRWSKRSRHYFALEPPHEGKIGKDLVKHDVAKGKKTILALEGTAVITMGNAPFFNMAQLGGTRRLRGYFEGKFRDKHLLLAQAELRQEGFGRFGGVAFAGMGTVFGSAGESLEWRPNGGIGLRYQLDKKQKLNIRADYGFGVKSQGFYLTFGEAF